MRLRAPNLLATAALYIVNRSRATLLLKERLAPAPEGSAITLGQHTIEPAAHLNSVSEGLR